MNHGQMREQAADTCIDAVATLSLIKSRMGYEHDPDQGIVPEDAANHRQSPVPIYAVLSSSMIQLSFASYIHCPITR